MKLPSELVLLATVHGGLPIENGQVKTFVVPEGMTITRIMATRPGICNVTSETQVDTVVTTMNINPQETVKTIKTTQVEVLKNISQQLKGDEPNKELFQQFVRSRIGNPTVKTFRPGDTMLDKFLLRHKEETLDKAFDFKLNAINIPGIPDLFDFMYFGMSGPAARTRSKFSGMNVDFSMMLDFLKAQGVTNLIFYDLTCSSFMSDVPMTERQERELRKTIVQNGWGKTRRRKNKTKSRKSKKRKTQWTH